MRESQDLSAVWQKTQSLTGNCYKESQVIRLSEKTGVCQITEPFLLHILHMWCFSYVQTPADLTGRPNVIVT